MAQRFVTAANEKPIPVGCGLRPPLKSLSRELLSKTWLSCGRFKSDELLDDWVVLSFFTANRVKSF